MSKNSFIKHMACDDCGSSDANALYSDGSTYCFSCRKSTQGNQQEITQQVDFKSIQTQLTLDEIAKLPVDTVRGISKDVLYDAGVRVEYDENRKIISHYYPITINSKVRAYKKRIVADKDFRVIGKADAPDLFNQSKSGSRKNLVITEGELDCLSLLQMIKNEAKFDVVSIVNGAQSARRNVASNLDFLNKYNKVIIAFDNDEAGIAAAKEVAHVIQAGKAHIVNFADAKDANEALEKNLSKEYLHAVWNAKQYKPDSFVSGEKVWEAFVSRSNVKSLPYPTCLEGLNKKLLGMRMGEIVLFTSGTGSGKSTVVKEIILNILDNTQDKIGLISLEESVGDSATKLIGMKMNKNFKYPTDINLDDARKAYEAIFADERITMLDHQGSVEDGNLIQRMEYLCAIGCKYLILDHITIATSDVESGKSGNEAVDHVMSKLLKMVKKYDVNLTLISHLRKVSGESKSFEEGTMANLDAIKGSGSIKQISFDIIAFARNIMADNADERNTVKFAVLKSRFTGDTGFAGEARYSPETGRLSHYESKIAFEKV